MQRLVVVVGRTKRLWERVQPKRGKNWHIVNHALVEKFIIDGNNFAKGVKFT